MELARIVVDEEKMTAMFQFLSGAAPLPPMPSVSASETNVCAHARQSCRHGLTRSGGEKEGEKGVGKKGGERRSHVCHREIVVGGGGGVWEWTSEKTECIERRRAHRTPSKWDARPLRRSARSVAWTNRRSFAPWVGGWTERAGGRRGRRVFAPSTSARTRRRQRRRRCPVCLLVRAR